MLARFSFRGSAILTVVALAAAPATEAQCLGPDNLTGPCCQQVSATLPAFSEFAEPAAGICWTLCQPSPKVCMDVRISAPTPTVCGQYTATIDVQNCVAAFSTLSGTATLDYTRTWEEVDPAGNTHQVFRFLAKVDFTTPAGVKPLCPVPPCLLVHPTAFFYGYVDYAFDCASGEYHHAVVLHHGCDRFIHAPVLSDKPGNFHPGTSFSIVAPDTAVNPFTPGILAHAEGALVGGAVRNVTNPSGSPLCTTEEPVSAGTLNPLLTGCACPGLVNPAQNAGNLFAGTGSCVEPSAFSALDLSGQGAPWRRLVSTGIGGWNNALTYPGAERVWVDEGVLAWHDSCAADPGDFTEIHYGATTRGGWTVAAGAASQDFLDLASNLSLPAGVPAMPPFFGSVRPTDHLVYVNFQ